METKTQTYLPPALVALFAPRPAPSFKPPLPKKPMPKLDGIAQYINEFNSQNEWPETPVVETLEMKREKLKTEKMENHKKILDQRTSSWHPHDNPKATQDPLKTLFVARLSYELNEDDLRDEFSRYGTIKDVKLVRDLNGKSRGYAFIEFKESRDFKNAFQRADGKRIKGRRILVDVERGRTVPSWKPRKLGGGLGKTRQNAEESKVTEERHTSRERTKEKRDHRERRHGRSRSPRSRERHHRSEKHSRTDKHTSDAKYRSERTDRSDKNDEKRHHRKRSHSHDRRHGK